MSRYSHSHHNNHHSQSTVHRGRPVTSHEEALANNSFEHFLTASTLKTIFGTYRNICDHLHLKPNCIPHFYPKLKAHVNSWKAKPLWKKFDARANQKCYNRGKACPNTRVLIIGAGPCGLRTAIEAQLLGAKVVVVEKRDRMTRNNVLHLWPFVIEDLRALGAKKFFGKFCAGAIDHISIRQLQCILLKVALLLGVEIHTEVSFERLIDPNQSEKTGWRAEFKPANHPVSQFEFDVIIGADGKRNTLQGFKRKEFRGKLAIAITANFINKRTEAEARVEEISGVAFIFNQKFFKDLYIETGIDLENIVYYKDDTHYFVMTAKKQSLIDKGVIRQDLSDTAKLLAIENVDRDELMNYAREAAEFSTNYQMPDLEFAVNHYGQPDVAMFDFTSMYAAENASRITERHGYRLLAILVGDSLLEPFWPTGSGCARGFLSSMDAAWAIRSWETATPLQVIAERESIYRLLAQTTPENLNKDYKSYTLDPTTRYPNLNRNVLLPHQVTNLFDTDNVKNIEVRPIPVGVHEVPKKRRRRESHVDPDTLLGWIQEQVKEYESLSVTNITSCFKDGRVLCAIIHHYRPDLLDYGAINHHEPAKNNQIAFDILEKELGIPPVMTGVEMAQMDTPDYLTQLSYLTQIYDTFRCEIPHIKHPKLDQRLPINRMSTCYVTHNTLPLRPVLVTPKSSAKVSDEESCCCSLYPTSNINLDPSLKILPRSIDTKVEEEVKESESDLLIVVKNNDEKSSGNVATDDQDNKVLHNEDLTMEKKMKEEQQKNIQLEIDGKEKLQAVVPTEKQSMICDYKGDQSIKTIPFAKKQRKKNVKFNEKPRAFDASGDESRKERTVRSLKPSLKTSSKSIVKHPKIRSKEPFLKQKCPRKTSKENCTKLDKLSKSQIYKEVLSGDATDEQVSVQPTITALPLTCKPTEDLSQHCIHKAPSMEGSSEVALEFLKEMDDFLAEQSAAYEKMNKTKNNLKVQILRPKRTHPPEIPEVLLDSRDNSRLEGQSDVIIIKNIERGNEGTISVEEVKVFSLANCIKVVPKLISSVTDHINPFSSKRNQVSFDDTTHESTKCQLDRSNYLENSKLLSREKMRYKGDKSEGRSYKVEDWLVSSNFDGSSDGQHIDTTVMKGSEGNDTVISTDPEMELQYRQSHNTIYHEELGTRDRRDLRIIHELKDQPQQLYHNRNIPRSTRDKRELPPDMKHRQRDVRYSSHTTETHPRDVRERIHENRDHPRNARSYYDTHVEPSNHPRDTTEDDAQITNSRVVSTKNSSYDSVDSVAKFMEKLKKNDVSPTKLTSASPWEMYEGRMRDKSELDKFQTIVEAEETDLPEPKRPESDMKLRTTPDVYLLDSEQVARTTSRHKRSVESFGSKTLVSQGDRKPRKRKTVEKIGASVEERQRRFEEIVANRMDRHNKRRQQRRMQTEQFLKSMQMLQSNCKPDHSEPFEDYSIYLYRQTAPNFEDRVKNLEKQFVYVPDRENRLPSAQTKRETDEDFAARIKDMEQKWQDTQSVDKKPKDLLRAIGKIETSDWNIREIEKKIHENKMGKSVNKDKERVPKWSKEQFSARLTKMEKQHLDRQNSAEVKYAEIDKNIKQLDLKLKEGSALDLNQQKVASIAEKLTGKNEQTPSQPKAQPIQKSNSRSAVVPSQNSEFCHFCQKRVYLMERLSAEGRFFHRGCFRCQYCQSMLRLGSYMFDREGTHGYRFYCTQHFGMPGELRAAKVEQKKVAPLQEGVPGKQPISGVLGLDLLDRVQTPERVEFSNLSGGHISSDHEESPSPIDEDEWTDRNFRNSVIDSDSTDDSSSSSDTDSDDEAYEEALEEPITKEGNMKWAERYKKRYSHKYHDPYSDHYSSSDHFSYDENSSGEDDSDTATEGEEEIRARELRKQEVRVEPPVPDTGTDTEIASCESSLESSSEIQNSATEISTDSEFAHDDPTPTRDGPKKMFDEFVTKTRGTGGPKKVQVKSSVLQEPTNGRMQKDIELKFTPLIPSPVLRKPPPPISLFAKNEGYSLNRTQSTGGIATKVSLELKKKYLLGEANPGGNIQKSGSASTLDSKFKSFHTNISDCQKLLKPAPEISASMQVFCNKLNERTSPLSPIFGGPTIFSKEKALTGTDLKSPNFNGLKTETLPKLELMKCASTSCVPETKSNFADLTEGDSKKIKEIKTEEVNVVVNETEGRPRSPVHEKSIIVPVIDWDKNKKDKEKFVDSLSSTDSELDVNITSKSTINNIPRLEVHDDSGAVLNEEFDSLNVEMHRKAPDLPKSVNGEKKILNQPKILPDLNNDSILPQQHSALHVKEQDRKEPEIIEKEDSKSIISGKSTPSLTEDINIALTETELSDWAREGTVSDDLEDVDFDINPNNKTKIKDLKKASFDEVEDTKQKEKKGITECVNILSLNLENIEFMDTGTESSDDNLATQNNGYVQFHNEDEFLEDSLSPVLFINNLNETANPVLSQNVIVTKADISERKNSVEEKNVEKLKQVCDNENDDSLVTVETGTTTEENTCSDSTVKLITEKVDVSCDFETNDQPKDVLSKSITEETNEKTVDEKKEKLELDTVSTPTELETPTNQENRMPSLEFDEHCQRLQSKIEFSNAKDSIDIRKTRRKSKPDVTKPDLIQEDNKNPPQSLIPVTTKLYKKEEIEKERNINQKLVQEMVMNKMRAQNKSLERKKRSRNSFSPIRPFELSKSATIDIAGQIKSNTENKINLQSTPDVLLSTMVPLQKSQTATDNIKTPPKEITNKLPDVSQTDDVFEFKTPKAPPRTKCDDAKRTAEKLKQDARARVRLMSDEDLGLSPEDKLVKLRQKGTKKTKENEIVDIHIQDSIESLVINRERRNSLLYNNDTLKRNTSFRRSKSGDGVTQSSTDLTLKLSPVRPLGLSVLPTRTKSVSEINRPVVLKAVEIKPSGNAAFCKSDPNLLTDQKKEKKSKDRERRKSITKFLTDMFSKKKDISTSPPSQNKGFLSRISPKSRTKSKDKLVVPPLRRNSISEVNLRRNIEDNSIPPPIPPLPANYTGHSLRDESSEGEADFKRDLSSCDALDQSGMHDESLSGRRPSRSARKTARQVQLKRHRMAQEIQRKLEETEVKTRELEHRGVMVEKALRGETDNAADQRRDEADLLKEWFDLMRERTELSRYEKELTIRAQELELEDRHARLQHELRERLEREEPKSKEEVEIEGSIIKEMMEIVAKRDSLIAVLEEDRLRHCEEDRDFEEKMLGKEIHLTSLLKTFDK